MILFFGHPSQKIYAVQISKSLAQDEIKKLNWLFGNAEQIEKSEISENFVGPRAAMITPWSTNAVEITQNMGVEGIIRIEEFTPEDKLEVEFDPMISQKYQGLHQDIFKIDIQPDTIKEIDDIQAYNEQEGLALSTEEVTYLEKLSKKIGRKLTDSEVFGFSQVNSEHCRHKIFNGTFIIDGEEQPSSLFKLIKKTSQENPNTIVSAYKDNVAFVKGPRVEQFAPKRADVPEFYQNTDFDSVISLKAETHNFPTTVEPFNGAATGTGGEIRDRLAGGKGSLPLAGTAVYMTAYSRLNEEKPWEKNIELRAWLYQTPLDILIKASNGASDFGNKFGQPLITGSVLTFEHQEGNKNLGYDKVIMLAGGIGYGKENQSLKDTPEKDDKIVILGGENYRIGMGGAAVSSADTGEFSSGIELNAIQRSNPEMQKRAANAIRGMVESEENTIVSIHDHGAGGHLNCLSELVEETGGNIDLDQLPVGDPTLSAKEIIGNESQERMGLVIGKKDIDTLKKIAERERSPMYEVGEVTNDERFTISGKKSQQTPMNLALGDMFGSSPKTVMNDVTVEANYDDISFEKGKIYNYTKQVLQLEAVACKDWLTNKVDRCVSGRIAKQQCVGELQIPLNNVGVAALDYNSKQGVATAIGHAPISALIDPVAGSKNSVAESLTNIIWAPLENGLKSVTLSANWMWPCNNKGEDARLYKAVKGLSDFAINLGINVPTGKDSLSMKQKYKDKEVLSPGTVIVSAAGHCNDIKKVIEPVLQPNEGSIYYINLSQDDFKLGGSSFAQILNKIGKETPSIQDDKQFAKTFDVIQDLIKNDQIVAGHDIGSGGLITNLLEMCFANKNLGANLDLSSIQSKSLEHLLFSENIGIVFQAADDNALESALSENNINFHKIGKANTSEKLTIAFGEENLSFDIPEYRDAWFETSYLLDQKQSGKVKAKERFDNYKNQPLQYQFPENFTGKLPVYSDEKIKVAIIREKGSNSEREMARALHLAGFEVKDVHMTDLISGRETLEDIRMIAAVGGFSNSDVLGSAKGWAGAFLYNQKANKALKNFFERKDTLSLGVCNGCQLFIELGLINQDHAEKPKMLHNDSHKFECTFTSVEIQPNNSVMLSSLAGSKLGIWSAHGEGKFSFPYGEEKYNIVGKYGYDTYPANPNGSDYNTAILTDDSGRHLVMMPHLERSTFPWNWAYYPKERKTDEVSPWIEACLNARKWLEKNS
ncbi:phosphoribosylformylglycinamidine synthase [Mesonia sp. K7]|uniref:phosphoribosylformylglycinamidine synthase n=1 Tax=Mesonia sp. K7 TaxID=2218606 RepID=UPI000DA8E93B|nr:phosphoribosylformylglycinamidine synthase [Mesonia sp. K7]PZD77923.1 phosphoribosylformylglycinamidine synthase [Mesonia sp. K7]